jgi:signal transduction histidine kinase
LKDSPNNRRSNTGTNLLITLAKVLVVDDDAKNLLALRGVLAPLAREIVEATSGEEALKQLLVGDFAVILMDVKMHGMDGFETAALIRSRAVSFETPIIFLTAHDSDFREARRAYDLGAFDYISKPFDIEVLRHKVAAFVRLHEQGDQLRKHKQELERKRSELVDAAEENYFKDVFIGVLGHDLRNPLGAIAMATALLKKKPSLADEDRRIVEHVERAADRMIRLVNDVLDFTRGKLAGGIPIEPARASIDVICRQVIDELRSAHPQRRIDFESHGDVEGEWDSGRLAQVVSNLVGNALQHCDRDPVQVAVTGQGSMVRISVRNSGCIPAEVLPRLFEPFRRGDGGQTGLGLGLYIVSEIVKAHGGRVDVTRAEALQQTEFFVELPRG